MNDCCTGSPSPSLDSTPMCCAGSPCWARAASGLNAAPAIAATKSRRRMDGLRADGEEPIAGSGELEQGLTSYVFWCAQFVRS